MGSRILTLQQRARELGRLRTGYTDHSGEKPRPVKSMTWVITSHAEHYIDAAAEQFGGTVETWVPLGDKPRQFRVITTTSSLDAITPPGDPISQANEMWSKGGAQRRCDGVTDKLSGRPCLCLDRFGPQWYEQSKRDVCSPTTRLNVMLPDMPDLGYWRVETKGINAAAEWVGVTDLIQMGTGGRGLVPISLRIEPRERVAGGKTKRFPVIAIEIRGITPRQALSGPLPTALALDPSGASSVLAIEAPRPDYVALANGGLTSDDVRDVWRQAGEAGHVQRDGKDPLSVQLMAIAAAKDAEQKKDDDTDDDEDDGVVDVEIVHDDEPQTPAQWPAAVQPGSGARR